MTLETPEDVVIPGTENWQARDWKGAAQTAYDNLALKKVFYQFIADQTRVSLKGLTVEDREAARANVATAELLKGELERIASQPVE